MTGMRVALWLTPAVGAALIGLTAPAPAVATQGLAAVPPPVAGASIDVAPMSRLDRQSDDPPSVTFTGVSAKTTVRVSWGDGSAVDARKGPCTPRGAKLHPAGCTVTFEHTYVTPGDFVITAASGRLRVTKTITLVPAPVAWTPPDGWVQPMGWNTVAGATFTPCQTVPWYFNREGETPNRSAMHDDVATALGLLSRETGLTFTETSDPMLARLTYSWSALNPDGSGTGTGGWALAGRGSGRVVFASGDGFNTNDYQGFAMLHKEWTDSAGRWMWDGPGHGWYAVKLTMWALGFTWTDAANQVMTDGYITVANFGAGDLDGLHTMYRNLPCPPIPD